MRAALILFLLHTSLGQIAFSFEESSEVCYCQFCLSF
jgi:hypothetical protein